jgi:hypothetical protein
MGHNTCKCYAGSWVNILWGIGSRPVQQDKVRGPERAEIGALDLEWEWEWEWEWEPTKEGRG